MTELRAEQLSVIGSMWTNGKGDLIRREPVYVQLGPLYNEHAIDRRKVWDSVGGIEKWAGLFKKKVGAEK